MVPIKPHWVQPSHPDRLHLIVNEAEFTSKSISKIALPPFALFAKLEFPPCTPADKPTYATVQCGRDKHLDLNSDLLYINHSCEPSLIFDTGNMNVIAGPKGIQIGEELTFFYPSTEWTMAQPFDCLCAKPTCRGRISGARDMTDAQLSGAWLNGHIRDLLEEQRGSSSSSSLNGSNSATYTIPEKNSSEKNGFHKVGELDQIAQSLRDALTHAEKVVEAARNALMSYVGAVNDAATAANNGAAKKKEEEEEESPEGARRRGPTSRELSGEMGGDTMEVLA
ncbi:hypothetical protein NEUTE1DRAFT_64645 [Neurospora tetrasperma FGSC 2508]|uniref:Post-SET domain-containing protein n=1 Tax=Neurospora tetrasperma (strain FGSC 2508 / ATCC MYA-4615 / P0657) TaxID=510951 RepID=F8MP32_NEUT8|nr:uncharacterized protein NEUTE1DRAFT_64645 [Neurospora tetrasperma FGSC 2508]EGO56251.1 hypothetical protein NEUTE1DRAFT_64645 [Neurospora tetrasperma FGSC 2508]EGZ70896.1 hypothetical protein NEUTE2DRAFT_92703 [Neurospora tetrasperma FGSC 2509]